MIARYRRLYETGELRQRAERTLESLEECTVCPRCCRVNRLENRMGKCRTGRQAMVSSYGPHFGEETPLVGRGGSGTVFFTNCNLECCFCQNADISQLGQGRPVDRDTLSEMMLSLERQGCHNINFVSPSHVVPQILDAVAVAVEHGLTVPLVYNSGGYDSVETLRRLDGVFDIYMPDMKYSDETTARRFSGVEDYPRVNTRAVREMHRQVGDLQVDREGVGTRGLLVRHLVLPDGLAGSEEIFRFLAEEVSRDTYVNIMAQYRPCHRAGEFPELSRPISSEEYSQAIEAAHNHGLHRLDRAEDRLARRLWMA